MGQVRFNSFESFNLNKLCMLHKIEEKINKIKIHINKKIKHIQKSFYHSITSRIDPEYIYIYMINRC